MDTPRRLILWTIAMIGVAIAIVWALYLARAALLLVYLAALFAIGLSPAVRFVERQRLLPPVTTRMPRWVAILVVYVVILGGIAFLAFMVVPPLVEQTQALWTALPDLLDKAQTWLMARGLLDHRITLGEAMQRGPGTGDTVGMVVGTVSGVVVFVFKVVTVLILAFYLLVDSDNLMHAFLRLFPRENRERAAYRSRQVAVKVSAWMGGQLLVGGIITLTAALGLFIFGVPYFFVLGLVAGVFEMIPIIGPFLGGIPAVIIAFTVSPKIALAVIIYYVVQQQLESHVLVPKLMARQVGVSAVFVLVALLIGGALLGVLGALLAVPTAAVVQVVLQELLEEDAEPPLAGLPGTRA